MGIDRFAQNATLAKERDIEEWGEMRNAVAFKILVLGAVLAVIAGPLSASAQGHDQTSNPAASAQGFPDANGPFSAKLILVAPDTLKELHKPSDQMPILQTVSKARVGDIAIAVFLFAGVERTPEQLVDVTYDLKIFAPDGQIYDKSDMVGQVALRTRVEGPPNILNNIDKFAGVRFETKDQKGVYRFEAVLHDNVAKRDIPLKAEVELIP